MESVPVRAGTLEGRADGSGEPLLLIHGSVIADTFACLRTRSELTSRYRVITYNRRGFAGSVKHTGPFSISEQAEDARAVLRHFGVERAHVAGHSYGGVTALQLALDAPESVASLLLLEPPLMQVPSGQEFVAAVGPVVEAFEAGDRESAILKFISLIFPEANWRERITPNLPDGWWAQSVADLHAFFTVEFPALGDWSFDEAEAQRIRAPVMESPAAANPSHHPPGHHGFRTKTTGAIHQGYRAPPWLASGNPVH